MGGYSVMALNIRVEDGLPITVEQACTILQAETDSFGLFLDLDRILEYNLEYTLQRDSYLEECQQYTGYQIKPSQREKVKDWFVDYFNIPERLLLNKANKVAFDKDVRKNLMDSSISDDAKRFLDVYQNWSAASYRVNYFKQYMSLPISYAVSTEGHRMVVASPTWNILSTSRLAASNPSIQNIARDMKDIICCPEGWTLVRADSGQIEPRITYSHYIDDPTVRDLIILYNDAYYGLLHYCQLSDDVYANRIDYRVAKPGETGNDPRVIYPKEITKEMKDGRKELKVLALAANYGSALAGRDPVLSKRYTDRIVNHPSRKMWEMDVTRQVRRGVETFHSVFGSVINPEETERYRRGTESWEPHVIRCGINNPIQTTASDLMVCSVCEAQKILSKTTNSHIAYYKHDEGAFYVHNSETSVVDELSGITAYNVTENGKQWIPIDSEIEMGQLRNEDVPSVLEWSAV